MGNRVTDEYEFGVDGVLDGHHGGMALVPIVEILFQFANRDDGSVAGGCRWPWSRERQQDERKDNDHHGDQ